MSDPLQIAKLLEPYASVSEEVVRQLSVYLDLLMRWNARTNLTAIREPEEMVRRHFGESLFAASVLAEYLPAGKTLLDYGSGAGFPGLPIQIARPELRVTLAESQNKKSTFLREVVRTLALPTEVFAGRVEAMEAGRVFDAVAMRAVDNMASALAGAKSRVAEGGILCLLVSRDEPSPEGFAEVARYDMPGSTTTQVIILRWR